MCASYCEAFRMMKFPSSSRFWGWDQRATHKIFKECKTCYLLLRKMKYKERYDNDNEEIIAIISEEEKSYKLSIFVL